jgi:hypothetical protein
MTEHIVRCPHCGNEVPHTVEAQSSANEELFANDGDSVGVFESFYYLARCTTCKNISLFSDWDFDEAPGDLKRAALLYPSKKRLDNVVPKAIKDSFEEAKKVERVSPNAFAVLTRRSLELLCKDQKAKGGNLKEKIHDLSLRGIIPATLTEMAEALRFLGNLGAHDIEFDFEREETQAMEDFLVAMLEYVYVAPDRIKKLTDSVSKKTKK